MTDRIKALRTLVKSGKRKGQRLEAELASARQLLAQCEADVGHAASEHARSVRCEDDARRERQELLSDSFSLAALFALDFRIDDLKAGVQQAERSLAKCREAAARQSTVVGAAQAAVRHNDQRVERFQQHMDALLREREAAAEEAADEEAQETAAARLVARQRSAAEAARHG